MKTNSIPCVKTVQNNKSQSNKMAKTGALVGLATSGAYLAKNFDDIFAKNIRNAKALNKFNPKVKVMIFGIPAAFVGVTVGAAALVGKIGGVIAEKVQAKKLNKEIEEIKEQVQNEEIQNSDDFDPAEVEKVGKMIDDLAAASLADLNKPIDFEALDAMLKPSEQVQDVAFKGSDYTPQIYMDSAPDIATIDFMKEFGKEYPVPTSKVKSESVACKCGKTHESIYNVFKDAPDYEMVFHDAIETYDKPNRPRLGN